MNLSLKGKTALVCGSTQGIGKASAIELAKLGATCVLIARDENKLAEAIKDLDVSEGTHDFRGRVEEDEPAASAADLRHAVATP